MKNYTMKFYYKGTLLFVCEKAFTLKGAIWKAKRKHDKYLKTCAAHS